MARKTNRSSSAASTPALTSFVGRSSGLKPRSDSEVNKSVGAAVVGPEKENDMVKQGGESKIVKSKENDTPAKSKSEQVAEWMTAPKVDDVDYWKELAEQRRAALEETLTENEKLHDELELVKAENDHLKKLADRAVALEQMLDELGYEVVAE